MGSVLPNRFISENQHVHEAFHRVLKCVYFGKKENKPVDNLLLVVLRIARDNCFDQVRKMEKGKLKHIMREVKNRHDTDVLTLSLPLGRHLRCAAKYTVCSLYTAIGCLMQTSSVYSNFW